MPWLGNRNPRANSLDKLSIGDRVGVEGPPMEQSRGAELLRQGSHDHCCDEIDASHLLLLSIYTTPSMEAAQPERRTDRCFDPGLESWWDLPIAMRKSKCRVRDPRALRG